MPRGLVAVLGLPSLALGVGPLVAAPAVARLIGFTPSAPTLTVLRLAGLRELIVAVHFLHRPSPSWMWAFLAQDAMDLAMAHQVLLRRLPRSTRRFRRALGAYVLIALVDVVITVWIRPRPAQPASRTE